MPGRAEDAAVRVETRGDSGYLQTKHHLCRPPKDNSSSEPFALLRVLVVNVLEAVLFFFEPNVLQILSASVF